MARRAQREIFLEICNVELNSFAAAVRRCVYESLAESTR
jgi:hypothetical protein